MAQEVSAVWYGIAAGLLMALLALFAGGIAAWVFAG